jgi:hypothetical protein
VILVSFGLWFIVVFGIRIAVWGNPLQRMVVEAEPALLMGVEALVLGQKPEGTPSELRFVRAFTQRVLLQLGMLCLELVVLAHLWWVRVVPLLCLLLLLKDLAAAGIGLWVAHRDRERGVLAVVRNAPVWLLAAERCSAIVSAVGALVLFVIINGLRLW